MTEALKISLLFAFSLLWANTPTSTADCCPSYFNCRSFWTNSPSGTADESCDATSLRVKGGWNDIAAVKSYYPLDDKEWFQVTCSGQQCGVGVSINGISDGGIRFNYNSLGFYWDAQTAFYGRDDSGGDYWTENFSGRLQPDSSTPRNTLAVMVDYKASKIWYRQSEKAAIAFDFPSNPDGKPSFYGQPLYAHVQVWNSKSLTHESESDCEYCVAPASKDYDWCPGYDPAEAKLSEYLFCESQDLVSKAYETAFIQGVRSGIMRPTDYARYDLQDWVYLDKVAKVYGSVCVQPCKFCDDKLRKFFEGEAESYQELADAYPMTYSVKSDFNHVVEILDATKNYYEWEQQTSNANDAEYTAVVMAPCLQLWGPLADRLFEEGAARMDSAYSFWVLSNMGYVPNDLNEILDTYDFDKDKALQIYQEGLTFEIELFNVAAAETSSSASAASNKMGGHSSKNRNFAVV